MKAQAQNLAKELIVNCDRASTIEANPLDPHGAERLAKATKADIGSIWKKKWCQMRARSRARLCGGSLLNDGWVMH